MSAPVADPKPPVLPMSPGMTPPLPAAAPNDPLVTELRVRIPVELHRQLLSLKVLRRKSLAESVGAALDLYFAERALREAAAVDGAGAPSPAAAEK